VRTRHVFQLPDEKVVEPRAGVVFRHFDVGDPASGFRLGSLLVGYRVYFVSH